MGFAELLDLTDIFEFWLSKSVASSVNFLVPSLNKLSLSHLNSYSLDYVCIHILDSLFLLGFQYYCLANYYKNPIKFYKKSKKKSSIKF